MEHFLVLFSNQDDVCTQSKVVSGCTCVASPVRLLNVCTFPTHLTLRQTSLQSKQWHTFSNGGCNKGFFRFRIVYTYYKVCFCNWLGNGKNEHCHLSVFQGSLKIGPIMHFFLIDIGIFQIGVDCNLFLDNRSIIDSFTEAEIGFFLSLHR